MERIVNALGKLASGKGLIYAVSALCATDAFVLSAQTFTVLENVGSRAGLVQATNGDLYGTIYGPGPLPGSVFKITPSGALTALYDFCSQSGCTDGKAPAAGLVQAANGDLYGTTSFGGANTNSANPDGAGTIFKITPSGTLTTLYSFCSQANCADGENPYTGLVQATNGDLYGTVYSGGTMGGGTIFKITPSGALTTLYNFCSKSGCVDGDLPLAGLVQAANGDFYGTTGYGGVANSSCQYGTCGTVFKITPGGALTTLYSFCSQSGCADGSNPYAGLVQATNGDLYGTTAYGGANCAPSGCGTVFKISPSGTLATLYSFCSESNCADGEIPLAGLVQAANRDLYGVTDYGGANGEGGTIFKITPSGALTTVYSFCAQSLCADGQYPEGLTQDTNGSFYGSAYDGGAIFDGTVFRLSVGLDPFVETRPTSGEVGGAVEILGSDLTGATSITFNGTAATFTVVSRYLITTTVPGGATTGTVQVATPNGTLSSNVPFRIP